MHTKEENEEAEGLKRLAFFGIAISTVATLTAVIAVPMLYNYMQHVQSSLQNEVDFCQRRANNILEEYMNVCDQSFSSNRLSTKAPIMPCFVIHLFHAVSLPSIVGRP